MDKIHFYGKSDKDALSYKSGELIIFTIYPAIGKEIIETDDIKFYKWEIQYDYGRTEEGFSPVYETLTPLTLTAKLDRPGFVRVIVEACDNNKLPLSNYIRFEGGAGVDVDKITLDTKIPESFDNFWESIKNIVDITDVTNVSLNKINDSEYEVFDIYEIKIDIPNEKPSQGILTCPKKGWYFCCRNKIYGVRSDSNTSQL